MCLFFSVHHDSLHHELSLHHVSVIATPIALCCHVLDRCSCASLYRLVLCMRLLYVMAWCSRRYVLHVLVICDSLMFVHVAMCCHMIAFSVLLSYALIVCDGLMLTSLCVACAYYMWWLDVCARRYVLPCACFSMYPKDAVRKDRCSQGLLYLAIVAFAREPQTPRIP